MNLEQKASLLSGRDAWSTEPVGDTPSAVLGDGPHGVRRQAGGTDHLGIHASLPATCFPPAVAVGSSWDPAVAGRLAAAVAAEARAHGVQIVLGPGVNIKRSPLCGRNFEYYSEDPLLSGVLATAYVRALQAQGVGASVKHFAANNQETDRMRVSAEVDERTLREIYLPAFERVVEQARPATVMAAYNKLNGVHAGQHPWLLTTLLRREWGFDGVVVSDWGAVNDRVAALRAGLDLQMPGNPAADAEIVRAVRDGSLDEAVVDRSAARVRAMAERWRAGRADFDADAHHALARELAAECAVLLKNDRAVLPIGPGVGTIAVVGPFATEPRFQGGGSSRVNPTRVDVPLEEIRRLAGERTVTTDPEGADLAIVFAGLADADESEGYDRTAIELPGEQVELIRATAAAARRTVVVLSNGGVVSLEGWHDDVDAVLEGWLLGQAGGGAVADLLFGVTGPSGRLAETIPLRLQDTPAYLNFPGEQGTVRYGEGVMVGYRYHETVERPVRYPFGHGLTYTAFAVGDLAVEVTGTDSARAALTVANTGGRYGKHVVQLYVATQAGPVRRPARELRAFTKVALGPGESTTTAFDLDARAFAYWDVAEGRWLVAPGEYTVQIGENASVIVAEATVELAGEVLAKELTLGSSLGEWLAHPAVGPAFMDRLTAGMTEEQRAQAAEHAGMLRLVESLPMHQFLGFLPAPLPEEALAELMALSRRGTRRRPRERRAL
ncbi:glycoside hydrolase family 3 C-terminal domain-containing protein [Planomonospora sp. ID91781]|uniref:glycoside hydrolase family 3 C-terminal domain-containing protein n=1 Tax=Planomonospora sp. ID91781 TaxID=2738135 RepID=UPI0018C3D397|nr:glycoside hydrolase family 3 C-terminal domain-containing protein [Planomonospora sp. ID91781]MBG0822517.1 glycoside hydrolase family 3 C-terminal domain-containing protein [Planomonospora sp. ID91781]